MNIIVMLASVITAHSIQVRRLSSLPVILHSWQPGEVIPLHSSTPTISRGHFDEMPSDYPDHIDYHERSDHSSIVDMLQTFQVAMQKQFNTLGGQLDSISSRIETIESKQ